MATIGVTRGLGDHDLKVHDSNIYIKPFLSSAPEVPQEVFISLLCKNVFSITPPWLSPCIQAAASSGPMCFGIVSHVCFLSSTPFSLQPSWFLLHHLLPRWLHGLVAFLASSIQPSTAIRAVFLNNYSDTCLLRNLQQHPTAQRIKPTLLHMALL